MVQISDTGKGILKRNFKKVFNPGYTSKKRGWGLGLSLARRIIAEYHNGKIRVLKSNPDTGTTMEISLLINHY
jgi:signal transduction histidine kinase